MGRNRRAEARGWEGMEGDMMGEIEGRVGRAGEGREWGGMDVTGRAWTQWTREGRKGGEGGSRSQGDRAAHASERVQRQCLTMLNHCQVSKRGAETKAVPDTYSAMSP